VITEKKGKAVP